MKHFILVMVIVGLFSRCNADSTPTKTNETTPQSVVNSYHDFTTPTPFQQAGECMIELKEGYKVWTKRIGNNPDMKVLLLHGGPALTHEYMLCFESFFPKANIEFYHYDQLGSAYSDQPTNDSLWTISRFVEEVEQVRQALDLDSTNFFLLGNSWGGILAMEYALKYQQHMKGMVVCNMTADFDKYEAYNKKLRGQMRPSLVDSLQAFEDAKDYHNEEYLNLITEEFYTKHILRFPTDEWPEPVNRSFNNVNGYVYEYMQGPSEFVPGGILKHWSVWDDLHTLSVPTLMVGAKYDSMNPKEMEEMSHLVQNGQYLHCQGSHLSMWDDQERFMNGVIEFITGVE
ncbi:MAG: proline iminopeptidase-family hydrolase [Flavobacteriales bacterium]